MAYEGEPLRNCPPTAFKRPGADAVETARARERTERMPFDRSRIQRFIEVVQAMIWSPRWANRSHRCEPMKPAAPVTRTRIAGQSNTPGLNFSVTGKLRNRLQPRMVGSNDRGSAVKTAPMIRG
jgi:hypothetical protein